jgi:hypothetical protein
VSHAWKIWPDVDQLKPEINCLTASGRVTIVFNRTQERRANCRKAPRRVSCDMVLQVISPMHIALFGAWTMPPALPWMFQQWLIPSPSLVFSPTSCSSCPSCPLIEVGSFKGTQQSRCLPSHLSAETKPVSETSCSLVFRIPDSGQSSKTQ